MVTDRGGSYAALYKELELGISGGKETFRREATGKSGDVFRAKASSIAPLASSRQRKKRLGQSPAKKKGRWRPPVGSGEAARSRPARRLIDREVDESEEPCEKGKLPSQKEKKEGRSEPATERKKAKRIEWG